MTQSAAITPVAGVVESINDGGFKLQGGIWLNYSNYDYRGPKAGLPGPNVGQYISGTVKNGKYLVSLSISDNVGNLAQPVAPAPQPNVVQQANEVVAQTQPVMTVAATQPTMTPVVVTTPGTLDYRVKLSIDTRLELLKIMALATPTAFDKASVEDMLDTVRALEDFVLEDVEPQPEPDMPADEDALEDEAL
jgi:hypothetical protein